MMNYCECCRGDEGLHEFEGEYYCNECWHEIIDAGIRALSEVPLISLKGMDWDGFENGYLIYTTNDGEIGFAYVCDGVVFSGEDTNVNDASSWYQVVMLKEDNV